ncbi:MAG: tellurite resistance TerB family protein [bacterium]|nr:tellurite resistance TerB family protein [bacterium]
MDSRELLDQLLAGAREWTAEGRQLAEKKLGVPESGPERRAMTSGMQKGALAAGVLALLLGTSAGRRLGGASLKLGGLAAVGTLAYQAIRNWQAEEKKKYGGRGKPVNELSGAQAENRSRILLKAMIAAANADGHIDNHERTLIESRIPELGLAPDTAGFIQAELAQPQNIQEIAAHADSPESAAEIYLVSRLVIDMDNEQERAYLEALAAALKLEPELVAQLEAQVAS